jgi:acyl-CoA dehydrogenase
VDFQLDDQSTVLAEVVRRVAVDHRQRFPLPPIESDVPQHDPQLLRLLGDGGAISAPLPAEAGGDDCGVLAGCAALVELGRCVSATSYLWSAFVATAAVAEFGNAVQRENLLPQAVAGTAALTAALATEHEIVAQRRGDGWTISGRRPAVALGTVAEAILVPAVDEGRKVVLLVRPDDPGVSVTPQRVVDGDQEALLELDEVHLDDDRLLGTDGAAVTAWLLTRATLGTCAAQAGVIARALELTAEYARERVQFGQVIGGFQAVRQRLADGYVDVEAVRTTMWQAAWRVDENLPATAEVAVAKFWAAEAGHRVAHTAVHVHGGVGIDTDHQLHRFFVAAKRNEFTLGSATEQLRTLGAELAAAVV